MAQAIAAGSVARMNTDRMSRERLGTSTRRRRAPGAAPRCDGSVFSGRTASATAPGTRAAAKRTYGNTWSGGVLWRPPREQWAERRTGRGARARRAGGADRCASGYMIEQRRGSGAEQAPTDTPWRMRPTTSQASRRPPRARRPPRVRRRGLSPEQPASSHPVRQRAEEEEGRTSAAAYTAKISVWVTGLNPKSAR